MRIRKRNYHALASQRGPWRCSVHDLHGNVLGGGKGERRLAAGDQVSQVAVGEGPHLTQQQRSSPHIEQQQSCGRSLTSGQLGLTQARHNPGMVGWHTAAAGCTYRSRNKTAPHVGREVAADEAVHTLTCATLVTVEVTVMTTGVFQLEGVYATVLGDTDSEGQDARMATWTLTVGPSVRRRVYSPVFPSAMNLHHRVRTMAAGRQSTTR